MDKALTKQLSTIITLKGGSHGDISVANNSFIQNIINNQNKIDVFQDLDSFLDIALENQDIYDKDKIGSLKEEMNRVLNTAAHDLDMMVVKGNQVRNLEEGSGLVGIPEEEIQIQKKTIRGLNVTYDTDESSEMSLKDIWGVLSSRTQLLGNKNAANLKNGKFITVKEEQFNELIGPLIKKAEFYQENFEEMKAKLDEKILRINQYKYIENDLDSLKNGIQKLADSLDIPIISDPKNETTDYYVKTLNLMNFEIQSLKENQKLNQSMSKGSGGGDSQALEVNFKKALNEIAELKEKLTTANAIMDELSDINYQNEISLQISQRELEKNKKDSIDVNNSSYNNMSKSQLVTNIEKLEETFHQVKAQTERSEVEKDELKERLEKYESQLAYYRNNNNMQLKEIENLKSIKNLYEDSLNDLNKAEQNISGLKKEIIDLKEFKRKYERSEVKFENYHKRAEDESVKANSDLDDLRDELQRAHEEVLELKGLLEARGQENSQDDYHQGELGRMYANSQREIAVLNQQLEDNWREEKQYDLNELESRNRRSDNHIKRLENKLEIEQKQIEMLKATIIDLEKENEKNKRMLAESKYDPNEMMELIHKIEESKEDMKFKGFTDPENDQNQITSSEYLTKIRKLKSRIASLEKDNKNMKIDLKSIEVKDSKIDKMSDRIERLNIELSISKSKGSKTDLENRYKSSITKLEKELQRSDKKIKQYERTIEKLRDSERDLNLELNRIIKDKETHDKISRSASKGKMPTGPILVHADHQGVDEKADPIGRINLNELNLSLEQENKAIKDELDFMTRLKDKFVKNLSETRKELVYAKEERDLAVKRREEMENELRDAIVEIDRYQSEKEELLVIIEELRRRLAALTDEYANLEHYKQKIILLSEQNSEMTEKIEIYLEEISVLKIRITELNQFHQKNLNTSDIEYKELLSEISIIQTRYSEIEMTLAEERKGHKETRMEMKQTLRRCEDLSNQCFDALKEIERLKSLLEEKDQMLNDQDDRNEMQNELSFVTEKVTTMSFQIDEYRTENEELRSNLDQMRDLCDKLRNGCQLPQHQDLINELKNLKNQNNQLQNQTNELRNQANELQNQANNLNNQLNDAIQQKHNLEQQKINEPKPQPLKVSNHSSQVESLKQKLNDAEERIQNLVNQNSAHPTPTATISEYDESEQESETEDESIEQENHLVLEREEWKKVKTYTIVKNQDQLNMITRHSRQTSPAPQVVYGPALPQRTIVTQQHQIVAQQQHLMVQQVPSTAVIRHKTPLRDATIHQEITLSPAPVGPVNVTTVHTNHQILQNQVSSLTPTRVVSIQQKQTSPIREIQDINEFIPYEKHDRRSNISHNTDYRGSNYIIERQEKIVIDSSSMASNEPRPLAARIFQNVGSNGGFDKRSGSVPIDRSGSIGHLRGLRITGSSRPLLERRLEVGTRPITSYVKGRHNISDGLIRHNSLNHFAMHPRMSQQALLRDSSINSMKSPIEHQYRSNNIQVRREFGNFAYKKTLEGRLNESNTSLTGIIGTRGQSMPRQSTSSHGLINTSLLSQKLHMNVLSRNQTPLNPQTSNGNRIGLYSKTANRLKVHLDNIEGTQESSKVEQNGHASEASGQKGGNLDTFTTFFKGNSSKKSNKNDSEHFPNKISDLVYLQSAGKNKRKDSNECSEFSKTNIQLPPGMKVIKGHMRKSSRRNAKNNSKQQTGQLQAQQGYFQGSPGHQFQTFSSMSRGGTNPADLSYVCKKYSKKARNLSKKKFGLTKKECKSYTLLKSSSNIGGQAAELSKSKKRKNTAGQYRARFLPPSGSMASGLSYKPYQMLGKKMNDSMSMVKQISLLAGKKPQVSSRKSGRKSKRNQRGKV